MRVSLLPLAIGLFAVFSSSSASPLPAIEVADLAARQSSTTWGKCSHIAPQNFKAFDLGNGQAQLTFDKGQYVGYQWVFDAVYADGATVELKPIRDFDNFRISDTFYTQGLGTQYLTKRPGSTSYTAVHEFTSTLRNGQAPVSWVFRTTSSNTACHASSYRFSSGRIGVTSGVSRPAQVTGLAARRTNDAGDWLVTWNAQSGAASYNLLAKGFFSGDEVGNPYSSFRGERVAAGTTSATTNLGSIYREYNREFTVTARNAQGVFSFTPTGPLISVPW